MDGKLPAGCASHREPAHHQTILVDRVVFLDVLDRLEQVDFTGKLVGVAVSAIGMKHERVRRYELARRCLPAIDKAHLAERFAPAVAPHIEPESMR